MRVILILLSVLLACACGEVVETDIDQVTGEIYPPYNLMSITGDGAVEVVFDLTQTASENAPFEASWQAITSQLSSPKPLTVLDPQGPSVSTATKTTCPSSGCSTTGKSAVPLPAVM